MQWLSKICLIFNHSFWREFIAADMIEEGRIMHEYE